MRITRDPRIRGGAFIIEGTRLTVIDLLYSLKRKDTKDLGITDEMIKAVENWLVQNNLNNMNIDKLATEIRKLELFLKKQELISLLNILLKGLQPEENTIEAKWHERFLSFKNEKRNVQEIVENELICTIEELKKISTLKQLKRINTLKQ